MNVQPGGLAFYPRRSRVQLSVRIYRYIGLRPKVAVALVPAQGDNVEDVLLRLDGILKGAAPDNRKNIYVVDSQPASVPQSMP